MTNPLVRFEMLEALKPPSGISDMFEDGFLSRRFITGQLASIFLADHLQDDLEAVARHVERVSFECQTWLLLLGFL